MKVTPGQVISHYHLLEKLGEGGMGVVWKAVDQKLDREIAIKFLSLRFEEDPRRLSRIQREAKAVAALNHPNIVTIYSIEEHEGEMFLTMELVSGRPLGEAIPPEGLPLERLLEIAIPLADALSVAHQQGITHRDLKPGNIMVSDEGRVKVLDFGLAQMREPTPASEGSQLPTQTGQQAGLVTGTLAYMSPEQIRGQAIDHRSDLFSLGIILYEMATARRPFQGETAADLMAAILKDSPDPVHLVKPSLPRHLGRLIQQCLAKDPRRRLQATLDLRNQLEDLRTEGSQAKKEALPSVAVLPFADMSREKDQDYFCEGIAEEIISALTKIQGLHVASRTSSFHYKKAALESREIGRRLGVNNLLEGSVRKAGEQLRITAQLIDVAEGFHLWSERFDRDMKDIFAIQDEIASRIAEALQVKLSPQERSAIKKSPTLDVEAYDCYLRGRSFYYQYRRKGIEFALRMFRRAIQLDSSYAHAYAGIADCCAFLYLYAGRKASDLAAAEEASRKALELDPREAQVHASRGVVLSLSRRHAEAEQTFETAIQLDPNLFEAHYFYARDCLAQGKLEKSTQLFEEAGRVRPEDYQSPLLVAQVYSQLGRKEAAEASRRKGLRIVEEHLKLHPDDARALYLGANGLVALGEREKGLEWAEQAMAIDPDEPMLLYNIGCIYSLVGEVEKAIDTLESSANTGLAQKEWFDHDSDLDPLRTHPRFQALMERLEKEEG